MIKVLSTTIRTEVQHSATNKGRFSIGSLSKAALKVNDGDKVLLTIKNVAGSTLFRGIKELISGEEIYDTQDGTDLRLLSPGQEIIVTIDKL